MIRGNRLVIPTKDGWTSYRSGVMFGDKAYALEDVPRIELSLDECEAVLQYLPVIIEFVIRERPKKEGGK